MHDFIDLGAALTDWFLRAWALILGHVLVILVDLIVKTVVAGRAVLLQVQHAGTLRKRLHS